VQLILSHTNADFDALGSMVGAGKLFPEARLVLTGSQDQNVREFLTLHEEFLDLLPAKAVDPATVSRVIVVETQSSRRLGDLASLVLDPRIEVLVYDHHVGVESDIPARERHVEALGAATTLFVRELRARGITPTPLEATTMLLGIYEDTGSFTFSATTPEDLTAAAWLIEVGANLDLVSRFVNRALSPEQRGLLNELLAHTEYLDVNGVPVAIARSEAGPYISELALLAHKLSELENVPLVFVLARMADSVYVVGRARSEAVNVGEVMAELGGGGHSRAASAVIRAVDVEEARRRLLEVLAPRVRREPVAREIMSVPARTISVDATVDEAQRRMVRYGHSGLSVVDDGRLVGVITRRDADKARHHHLSHAPVKGFMTRKVVTAGPDTPLSEMERRMIERDVGRLPVVEDGRVVGVVTRRDLLRWHCGSDYAGPGVPATSNDVIRRLEERLPRRLQAVLRELAAIVERFGHRETEGEAPRVQEQGESIVSVTMLEPLVPDQRTDRGLGASVPGSAGVPPAWSDAGAGELRFGRDSGQQRGPGPGPALPARASRAAGPAPELYLVGGFVRDLLLDVQNLDVDLVVVGDATRFAAEVARVMDGKLKGHHRFATATVTLPDGLKLDFSTARSEAYGQPGALPEVEASSIEDDLKRRDFSINAMAIRVDADRFGQLLDPFGGRTDLERGVLRVLHNLSFIEDPTRIFRAVRFETRYGFRMDDHTEALAHHALERGGLGHISPERLRAEFQLLFREPNPLGGLLRIEELGILAWLAPDLVLRPERLERVEGALAWIGRHAKERPERTVVYLAALLADLGSRRAAAIAGERLRLSEPKRELLALCLERVPPAVEALSQEKLRPHEIYRVLRGLPVEALALIRVWSQEPEIDARLDLFLSNLRCTRLAITGDDLRALGIAPGPEMGEVLRRTLDARLDGEVDGREAELAYALHLAGQG
jgi:tRNA nucleotidyltransferase (CCA-adding enzyme)